MEDSVYIYRVSWEQRYKPKCGSCCTEENHPWDQRFEQYSTKSAATNQEGRVWDIPNDGFLEVRDVKLERALAPNWEEIF